MPWSVERTDGTVRVRITPPVDDWEALMDEIWANLDPLPTEVAVPGSVPGATSVESNLLDLLCLALRDEGIPLRKTG